MAGAGQDTSEVLELSQSDIAILPEDDGEVPVVTEDLKARFSALRDGYLAELKRIPPAQRQQQARLLHEIGRIEEEILGDVDAALRHHSEAAARDPGLRPNLRSLRRLQLDRDDPVAAQKTLDAEIRVCKKQNQRATLLYEKALLQLEQGDSRGAESSLRRAMDMDATFLPGLAMLAHLAEARGDTDAAAKLLVAFAQISEDERRKALIFEEVASLVEGAGKAADALDRYRIALGYDPLLVGPRFALQRLYVARGEWGSLTDLLLQTADRSDDPTIDAAYRFLAGAVAVHRLGEDLRAAVLLEQSFERRSRALPLLELDEIYARHGKARERLEVLARRLTLGESKLSAREQAAILFRMGELHEQLQEPGEGALRFRAALERSRGYLPARRALIRSLREAEHWAEVRGLLREDADNEADPGRRYALLVELAELVEWELEEPEEAVSLYEEALGVLPALGPANRALDRLYSERKQWEALTGLLQAEAKAAIDPGRRIALEKRRASILEAHLGESAAAAEILERLLGEPASGRDVALALTRVYSSEKRFQDLVQNLEREAEASTDPGEVLSLLSHAGEVAELQLGDSGRARQLYLKVLERDPHFLPALQRLSRLYLAAGYWDELVATYRQEVEILPPGGAAAILSFRIAQILESRVGDDRGAERAYRDALEHDPDLASASEALVALLARRGRWKDRVELLRSEAARLVSPDRRGEELFRAALVAFHHTGSVAEALSLCEEALRTDHRLLEAQLFWEQVSASDGRFEDLVHHLEEILEDDGLPRQVRTREGLKLAVIQRVQLRDLSAALQVTETVLALDPRNREALYIAASLAKRSGRMKDLADFLGRLADSTADPVTATADLVHLAAVLPSDVSYDALRADLYDRVLSIHPTHPFALGAQERLARRAEDFATLMDILRRRAEEDGDAAVQTSAWMTLGDLSWCTGDLEEAATCYSKAQQASPGWLPGLRGLRALREAQGRQSEVAELLEQEAGIVADREAATEALMQAANIWLQSYMDTERAERLYAQVFEQDPRNGVAFQRLSALLGGRDAHAELTVIYRKRIDVARREEKVDLLVELAKVWDEHLGRPEESAAALDEALRLAPRSEEALLLGAQINGQLGRWRAASGLWERLVQVSQDPARVRSAWLRRAQILEQELGEDAQALQAIDAVLGASPDDPEALQSAVRLLRRMGRWDRAAETLGRLAEHAPPAERARLLLERAEVEAQGLGRPRVAEELVARAAALCSLAPEALPPLEAYFDRRQDPQGLDVLLEHVLRGAPPSSPGIVPLRLARARNLGDCMGELDAAEKEIRQALTESPGSVDALLALGKLHLGRQNAALAQMEYQNVLERDPFHAEAYRGLHRVFGQKGEPDRARLAAQVLVALEAATAEENAMAAEIPSPADAPGIVEGLGISGYLRHIAPQDDPAAARDLLSALFPYLHLVFPSHDDRYGVAPEEDLPEGHPLKERAAILAKLLGLDRPYRVALGASRPDEFSVEHGPSPVVIVGESIAVAGGARLDFLLGRGLGRILASTVFLSTVNLRDLEVTLAAVAAQFDRTFGLHLGADEDLQALGKSVLRQMGRKARRAVEEPARAYAAADPVGMHAWAESAAQSAARCGLLCSASLPAGLPILRSENARPEELAGLCIFNISPRYAEARRILGLST